MKRKLYRSVAAVSTILVCAAIAVFAFPGEALAAAVDVPADYDSLQAAIRANETNIVVSAGVAACDIPAGVSISFSGGGSIAGDFANYGTVSDPGKCSGRIYDYTGSLAGGNVRVQGSSLSGVTKVYYSDGVSETANYRGGVIWIPAGKSIALVVIDDFICTPTGGKIQYTVAYQYADTQNSPMKNLDSKNYPAMRYLMESGGITIPEAPDKEVDYVFKGWYCAGLGYTDPDNLPKTITIDGNFAGNLTLVSNWTYVNGHNEGLNDTPSVPTGDTGSAQSGGYGKSGAAAGTGAVTASEDDKDEDVEAAAINSVLTGQGNGMRVRNAKSTSRHSFSDTGVDVESRAAQRRQSRFPWQWVGVGAGGALLLLAAGVTLRRKRIERNEATLEKLNIHD